MAELAVLEGYGFFGAVAPSPFTSRTTIPGAASWKPVAPHLPGAVPQAAAPFVTSPFNIAPRSSPAVSTSPFQKSPFTIAPRPAPAASVSTSWTKPFVLAPAARPDVVIDIPTPKPILSPTGPTAPIPSTSKWMATRFPWLSPTVQLKPGASWQNRVPVTQSPTLPPQNVPTPLPDPTNYIPKPDTVPDVTTTPSNDTPDVAPASPMSKLMLPLAIAAVAYFSFKG